MALEHEVADGDVADSALAHVTSLRERALQTTQARLMQEVKKLDAGAAALRSRNAKLQDEMLQKDQQLQDAAAQLKQAEGSIDELSHMVQVLQYQLLAAAERPGQRDAVQPSKGGAGRARDADWKRSVGFAVRPLSKRLRRICSDYQALRRCVADKLSTAQNAFQADGALLLQLVADLPPVPPPKPRTPAAPPPLVPSPAAAQAGTPTTRSSIASTAPGVRPWPAAFLELEAVGEPCAEPHLTESDVSSLETVVGRLNVAVCLLSTTAGVHLDLVPIPVSPGPHQQLANVQRTLAKLHQRAEWAADQVAIKLAREQQEVSARQLQLMEEQEEEIQLRVAKCTELLLKAQGDPTTSKALPLALAETEASIETRHKEPAAPKKVDQGCQCTIIIPAVGSNNKRQEIVRSPTEGSRTPPSASTPTHSSQQPSPAAASGESSPRRLAVRHSVPAAGGGSPTMFQRTVENIERLLALVPGRSPFSLQLEMLLREARELLDKDPCRWQPPPVYQTCPDDHRAIHAFKQWNLKRRVQLSRQHFLTEGLFGSLQGWCADRGLPRLADLQAPTSPRPGWSMDGDINAALQNIKDVSPGSPTSGQRPGHSPQPWPPWGNKEVTGIVDFATPRSPAAAPHHRSLPGGGPFPRLQPLPASPSSPGRARSQEAPEGAPPTSPVARRGDGLSRRRLESALTIGARQTPATDDATDSPGSPSPLPPPRPGAVTPTNGRRLTPVRSSSPAPARQL